MVQILGVVLSFLLLTKCSTLYPEDFYSDIAIFAQEIVSTGIQKEYVSQEEWYERMKNPNTGNGTCGPESCFIYVSGKTDLKLTLKNIGTIKAKKIRVSFTIEDKSGNYFYESHKFNHSLSPNEIKTDFFTFSEGSKIHEISPYTVD